MEPIPFPVIDADAHVNEPPDLWTSRLPAALRARGPRVMAILPATGVEAALAELDHALRLGHKGVLLSSYPNGSLDPDPAIDDHFWAAVQEADLPVGLHIGSFSRYPLGGYSLKPLTLSLTAATKSGAQASQLAGDFIFTGIPERFPRLKIVLVEANIGWIPSWLEQMDDNYLRNRFWSGVDALPRTPSEYFRRQFYTTFMVDRTGVELRHRIGVENLLWSTDFPHAGSDWPNSRWVIERNFEGVPLAEKKRMLHDNAAALFRIQLPGAPE